MKDYDIHKSAGIILQNRRQLVVRPKSKDHFVEPGGKIDPGESVKQALVRELYEELSISVEETDLEFFGTYYAIAAGSKNKKLRMDVFMVKKWRGEPVASQEIEELAWVGSTLPDGMKVGSILEHEVNPELTNRQLIN